MTLPVIKLYNVFNVAQVEGLPEIVVTPPEPIPEDVRLDGLREVLKAILTSPEFASANAYRAKVKTPLEFVASALRATGADVRTALPLARTLRDMGMPLYFCQPPTGYDETAATWVSAGALVARMNFAVDLSKNAVRGVRVPLSEEQTMALKIGAPEFQRQ